MFMVPPSPSENSESSVFYSYSSLWKDPIFQFSRGNKTVIGQSPPQGNHLHQRQGGGGLRQADTFRDEQARERAEPHGHRL